MKKSFFVGIGVCVLGFIVLLVAFYAMYMNGGTRLLYENSVWGARWRNYPWVFLAAAVLFAGGGVLLKVGYVPKAKRPKKVRPVAVPKMVSPSAADTGAAGTPSPALQEPAVSFDLNGGEESSAPAAAATVEEKAEKNVEQAAPVPYGQDENTAPSAPVASVPAQPAVSFDLNGREEFSAPAAAATVEEKAEKNVEQAAPVPYGQDENTAPSAPVASVPAQPAMSFDLNGGEESSAPVAAATVEEKAEKNVEQAAPVPYGQDENTAPSAPVASVPAQPAVSFDLNGGEESSAPAAAATVEEKAEKNVEQAAPVPYGQDENTAPSAPVASVPAQPAVSFNLDGGMEPFAPAQQRTSVNFDLSGVSQNTVSMPWQSGVSFNLSGVEEAPAQRPEQSYEGFTLEQQTKQEQPAGKRCPVCGKENGPEFHFCANCGTKL